MLNEILKKGELVYAKILVSKVMKTLLQSELEVSFVYYWSIFYVYVINHANWISF